MRLGLVVNPIAGMGGRLAFKGSDDVALVAAARERGEAAVAPARATEALRRLTALGGDVEVLLMQARWVRTKPAAHSWRPR